MPRKRTVEAVFASGMLMAKYREDQKELQCIFVDFKKVYDREVAEKYVRVVQDMYEGSMIAMRCAVGITDRFLV